MAKVSSVKQCEAVSRNRTMPLDVLDFRSRYAELRKLFSEVLGLLMLVHRLKMPMARESFTAAYVSHCAEVDEKKRIFLAGREVCRQCSTSFGKEQFDQQFQEIRGPLNQGFIAVMKWLRVIRGADAFGRASVQLGVSGQYYELLPYSADAAAFIDKYCQLHLTMLFEQCKGSCGKRLPPCSFAKKKSRHKYTVCLACQFPSCVECGQQSSTVWTANPKVVNDKFTCDVCASKRQCQGPCGQRMLPIAFDSDAWRRKYKVCRECKFPTCATCGRKRKTMWTRYTQLRSPLPLCEKCETKRARTR